MNDNQSIPIYKQTLFVLGKAGLSLSPRRSRLSQIFFGKTSPTESERARRGDFFKYFISLAADVLRLFNWA